MAGRVAASSGAVVLFRMARGTRDWTLLKLTSASIYARQSLNPSIQLSTGPVTVRVALGEAKP